MLHVWLTLLTLLNLWVSSLDVRVAVQAYIFLALAHAFSVLPFHSSAYFSLNSLELLGEFLTSTHLAEETGKSVCAWGLKSRISAPIVLKCIYLKDLLITCKWHFCLFWSTINSCIFWSHLLLLSSLGIPQVSVIGVLFSLHYFTAIYGSDSHIFLFELLFDCHQNEAAPKLPLLKQCWKLCFCSLRLSPFMRPQERELIASSHMACSQTHLIIYYYEVTIRSGAWGR